MIKPHIAFIVGVLLGLCAMGLVWTIMDDSQVTKSSGFNMSSGANQKSIPGTMEYDGLHLFRVDDDSVTRRVKVNYSTGHDSTEVYYYQSDKPTICNDCCGDDLLKKGDKVYINYINTILPAIVINNDIYNRMIEYKIRDYYNNTEWDDDHLWIQYCHKALIRK